MKATVRTILLISLLALVAILAVPATSFAQEQAPEGGAPAGEGERPPMGPFSSPLTMMLVVILIFWFVVLAPQKKQQKKHRERVSQLKSGDKVLTSGGIYGTVRGRNVDENRITVEIAKNIQVEVAKNAITTVFERQDQPSS